MVRRALHADGGRLCASCYLPTQRAPRFGAMTVTLPGSTSSPLAIHFYRLLFLQQKNHHGTCHAIFWTRKTTSGCPRANNNNSAVRRDRARANNNHHGPWDDAEAGATTTRQASTPSALRFPTTTSSEAPNPSGRDAPTRPLTRTRAVTAHLRPTTATSRRKANRMPSWLDYCFEYETVATRNVDKHNNPACL